MSSSFRPFRHPPFTPSFPTMSVTLSFLAGLLLKMYEKQSWTADEMDTLKSVLSTETETQEVPMESAVPLEAPKKVKKVKKVEPLPEALAQPAPAPAVLIISQKHCLARMVQKAKPLSGTEDNKVYEAKQCIRLRAKGQLLCPKCEEYYTAYKEKSKGKGKANWEGFINEKPLDGLHIVGSKWFDEHYPAGLPQQVALATSLVTTFVTTPVPCDPAQETVLAENAPVLEIKWATVKIGGIQYIYNTYDRRIYRADVSKEGEDQILWDSFSGKYINGEIDVYAPETEEP